MRASSRALALSCTILLGCIPSHRMVHEGDRYFERCYAADFTERVAADRKEACWQAWIAHYTKHQPAHRVDYALRRVEALQSGEPTPRLPGLSTDPATPTNALGELALPDASVPLVSAALLSPLMQGDAGPAPQGCAAFCADYVARCRARCTATDSACGTFCEREQAFCEHGCY